MGFKLPTPPTTATPAAKEAKPAPAPAPKPPANAEKPAAKSKVPKAKLTDLFPPKLDRLREFCDDLNGAMKSNGRVDIGADISWLDPPRIRTSILGLDVITAGGYPRGGLIEHWGPASTTKTTTALKVLAAEQQRGMDVFMAMPETFSKSWARVNGLFIPHSPGEYELEEKACRGNKDLWLLRRAELEQYDKHPPAGTGSVVLIQHSQGDGLLEAVTRIVRANVCSVGLVDSIAVCRNTRQLEEAEVGDEERGGGGQNQMINRFLNKCFAFLNRRYNEKGEEDANGVYGNMTTVICNNQARQKQQQGGPPKRGGAGGVDYKPWGGEGMRHAWHFSAGFKRGGLEGDRDRIDDGSEFQATSLEVKVRGTKSKVGPEGRVASWNVSLNEPNTPKGFIDPASQARIWAVYYDVIKMEGAWYEIPKHICGGARVNGRERLDKLIREADDLRLALEEEVIAMCRKA